MFALLKLNEKNLLVETDSQITENILGVTSGERERGGAGQRYKLLCIN